MSRRRRRRRRRCRGPVRRSRLTARRRRGHRRSSRRKSRRSRRATQQRRCCPSSCCTKLRVCPLTRPAPRGALGVTGPSRRPPRAAADRERPRAQGWSAWSPTARARGCCTRRAALRAAASRCCVRCSRPLPPWPWCATTVGARRCTSSSRSPPRSSRRRCPRSACPDALLAQDAGGYTPLARACRAIARPASAPGASPGDCLETVLALIRAEPAALRQPDPQGRLPAHILARHHGASLDALRLVLWQHPPAAAAPTRDGWLLLHYLARYPTPPPPPPSPY